VRRSPDKFSKALEILDKDYMKYIKAVESFQKEIRWQSIASQHAQIYAEIIKAKQSIIAM
jgi:hypothetical protein